MLPLVHIALVQGYHVTCVHVISLFILMIPADLYWIQRLKTMNSQTFFASTKVSNAYIQISRQIDMMNESDNYTRPRAREF